MDSPRGTAGLTVQNGHSHNMSGSLNPFETGRGTAGAAVRTAMNRHIPFKAAAEGWGRFRSLPPGPEEWVAHADPEKKWSLPEAVESLESGFAE